MWLKYFKELINKSKIPNNCSDKEWTEHMGKVLDGVGKEMKCEVIRSSLEKGEERGGYLKIDTFFMDKSEYNDKEIKLNPWGDPFVESRNINFILK